ACWIMPAPIRVGTPLCDCCWKWGYMSLQCNKLPATCAHCEGLHELKNYGEFAVCCRLQLKNKPPIPGTPAGQLCPHAPCCVNCGAAYQVDFNKCPFHKHQFNKGWAKEAYKKERSHSASPKTTN